MVVYGASTDWNSLCVHLLALPDDKLIECFAMKLVQWRIGDDPAVEIDQRLQQSCIFLDCSLVFVLVYILFSGIVTLTGFDA